jgi:hypothetical protein
VIQFLTNVFLHISMNVPSLSVQRDRDC